jgi:hypothetical protein
MEARMIKAMQKKQIARKEQKQLKAKEEAEQAVEAARDQVLEEQIRSRMGQTTFKAMELNHASNIPTTERTVTNDHLVQVVHPPSCSSELDVDRNRLVEPLTAPMERGDIDPNEHIVEKKTCCW